jgi:hypothetical protein
MNVGREIVTKYIDETTHSLDIAVFVGGSLLEDRYENLVAASARGVKLRLLLANAMSGWADQLARPFGLKANEYEQRIYVSASRALMIGAEVRWQPFPLPWSFMISDDARGYVKAIDFVSPGALRVFAPRDLEYYRGLFDQAWSVTSPVADRPIGRADVVPTLRVFLCHASDDKDAVRALHCRLQNDGVDPWLDEEELLPGQDWESEISRAIRQSDVFVICLSATSIGKRGFLQREIRVARRVAEEMPSGTIFIVPARLDECAVPEDLRHLQWVDLFRPKGYETLLRGLKVARSRK